MLYEGIATGTLPYKNQSQIYEALIIKGLELLGTEESEEAVLHLRAAVAAEESERSRKEAHAAFSRAKTEMKEIESSQIRGADDEACRLYWLLVWNFKAMRPDFWRDWFIKRMKEEYPEYDKREPKGPTIIDKHNEEYDERWESRPRKTKR